MRNRKYLPGGEETSKRLNQIFAIEEAQEREAQAEAKNTSNGKVVPIDRELIDPDTRQPRQYFPFDKLRELAHSLRSVGQIQPILLRPHPLREGRYMIVVGERRWRASGSEFDDDNGSIPKLKSIIAPLTEYEAARMQIDENEKREDVSPVAIARGYKRLFDMFGKQRPSGEGDRWTRVADEVGISRRQVLRYAALLSLPKDMIEALDRGALSASHGRALVSLADYPDQQKVLFRKILRDNLGAAESIHLAKDYRDAQESKPKEEPQQESAPLETLTSRPAPMGMPEIPSMPTQPSEGGGFYQPQTPHVVASIQSRRERFLYALSHARKNLQNVIGLNDDIDQLLPSSAFEDAISDDVAKIRETLQELERKINLR